MDSLSSLEEALLLGVVPCRFRSGSERARSLDREFCPVACQVAAGGVAAGVLGRGGLF